MTIEMRIWLLSANAAHDITPLAAPVSWSVRGILKNAFGSIRRYALFWEVSKELCDGEMLDRLGSMRKSLQARCQEMQKYLELHIHTLPQEKGDELVEAIKTLNEDLHEEGQKGDACKADNYPSAVPLLILVSIMAEGVRKGPGQRNLETFYCRAHALHALIVAAKGAFPSRAVPRAFALIKEQNRS